MTASDRRTGPGNGYIPPEWVGLAYRRPGSHTVILYSGNHATRWLATCADCSWTGTTGTNPHARGQMYGHQDQTATIHPIRPTEPAEQPALF